MEDKKRIVDYVRSLDVLTEYQQEKIIKLHIEKKNEERNDWYKEWVEYVRRVKESELAEELVEDLMDLVERVREIKNR